MHINKNKNEYGTYKVNMGYKKNTRVLVVALIVVIFVLSIGVILFNKSKKPSQQAILETTAAQQIPGWWYQKYFGSSVCNQESCQQEQDPDRDKLSNEQEYFYQSDPLKADTNGNGITDGQDVASGFAPDRPDKTKFEDLESTENALGESLVFDQEIKQIITGMTDPTKVKLPEVKNSEIIVSKDNSKEAVPAYLSLVNATVARYFTADIGDSFQQAAQNGDDSQITEIKIRSIKLLAELKTIPAPPSAVQLHKYYIGLAGLIPQVVTVPGPSSLDADTTRLEDDWYDSAQAYLVLIQKTAIEKAKLKL